MSQPTSELAQIRGLSSYDNALWGVAGACAPRRTRLAYGHLILAVAANLALLPCSSAHPQIADPVPATHPCAFIGVWSESKNHTTYKVTLSESGGFVREPIAPGTSSATYTGLWEVRGDKLEWKTNDPPHSEHVNRVKNFSAKSFTLIETDGIVSEFDLIEATKTPNCPHLN